MAEEHEIKLLLKIPLEEFIQRAQDFGFVNGAAVAQTDTYFDTENWDLYHSVSSLRIRAANGREELAYKKLFSTPNRSNPWYVQEVEASFPIQATHEVHAALQKAGIPSVSSQCTDGPHARLFLKKHGLLDTQVMEKSRHTYRYGQDIELIVDSIQGMRPIVELESRTGDPTQLLQRIIRDDEWERTLIGTSYLWLETYFGLTDHRRYAQRFQHQPDWNVTPAERSWYEELNQKS